jgi:SAM-dependent methyltransferase
MGNEKPFSEASERNRVPILAVLVRWLGESRNVLEIGSGTGQHAAYFAAHLPHLAWQPSDVADNLPGIRLWIDEARLPNLQAPLALDVNTGAWPEARYDAVFSANTAHIMSWPEVERMVARAAAALRPGGLFCLYGPFNYAGGFTSESNARFDASLRARDPRMGVRDFEATDALARREGLELVEDNAMPANNRLLVWRRAAGARRSGAL